MPDPYDEATALFPKLGKYKKLIVSLLGTTTPFVVYLTSGAHSPKEIVAVALGWLATNFGVYRLPNAEG
ncbi:MAG TPA: hypothetical protein VEW07_11415 [Solirubrobacterales bacterium]|nr:hypothetical protein [Solirubrobacterales bacterium]